MGPDSPARAIALSLATALHVALGWALLSYLPAGSPVRGAPDRRRGTGLVIELIPLERDGVARRGDSGAAGKARLPDTQHITTIGPGAVHETAVAAAVASGDGVDHGATTTPLAARETTTLPAAEILAFRARLQEHLGRYRSYPAAARHAGQQGVVQVHFVMDRAGHVIDSWIESGSGIDEIDREALASIQRAQPLPPLPRAWPDRLDISLPITFKIG